mgnify:CR=1 FL=1
MNYSKKEHKKQEEIATTWLQFRLNGTGVEWFDIKLPFPNYLLHLADNGYRVAWQIVGNESKHIEEIRARFVQTFYEYSPEVVEGKPRKNTNAHTTYTIHELKEFNVLDSLRAKAVNIARVETIFSKDEIFWHLKFYFEYLIKRDIIPTYSDIERFAYAEYQHKCKSTLRAKCRSIYNWYAERDFKAGRVNKKYENMREYQELNMATRKQQAKKMTEQKIKENRTKILSLVTGLLKEEYRKKNGEWNISSIAKDTKTSRNTVYKYLKEI